MHTDIGIVFAVLTFGLVIAEDAVGPDQNGQHRKPSALSIQIGTSKQQAKQIQEQHLATGQLTDGDLNQLQLQIESSNDLAHRMLRECPNTTCTGLDCAFITVNGCKTCICPIGSPARGCDRLPEKFWSELMSEGCPNEENPSGQRTPVRKVIRWYRHTDTVKGTSECRYYMFPFCTDSDFNFWRSPRTKAECSIYCFHQGDEVDPTEEVPL